MDGAKEAIVGAVCSLIVKSTIAELAPPLAAFETVTATDSGTARSVAGRVAVNEVAET
jgi:hypothetical protein